MRSINCVESYMRPERAPTSPPAAADYIAGMDDQDLFADAELPFHVWVRERTGTNGFRWVLREAQPAGRDRAGEISDPGTSTGGAGDSPG